MKYVIFDDEKRCSFFPLTFTHSTGDLRVGILKLRQRILAKFSILETNVIIWSDLEKMYRDNHQQLSQKLFHVHQIPTPSSYACQLTLLLSSKF